jgi:hypothetical protein
MGAPSTERAGVRQAIRALVADGWTLHSVDSEPVCTETEAMTEIEAVGFAWLYVRRGDDRGAVFFTMQNGAPDEVICDYTTNLTAIETLTNGWY